GVLVHLPHVIDHPREPVVPALDPDKPKLVERTRRLVEVVADPVKLGDRLRQQRRLDHGQAPAHPWPGCTLTEPASPQIAGSAHASRRRLGLQPLHLRRIHTHMNGLDPLPPLAPVPALAGWGKVSWRAKVDEGWRGRSQTRVRTS